MTKIGILTAARTNNNGTDLQAFAMQKMLTDLGADVEIINYKCPKLEKGRKVFVLRNLKDILRLPMRIYAMYVHERFRRKHFCRSKRIYKGNDLATSEYGTIIVGSDQIWNMQITGGDINFFLPFDDNCLKRYSYAASLGEGKIAEWNQLYNIEQYLSKFQGVSVRECSSVAALAEKGITARHDLDPLLMVDKNEWLCRLRRYQPARSYVLLYLVEESVCAVEYARNYARQHQCEVLWITNGLKHYQGIHCKRFVDVDGWLTYVANAKMVVTNSYHGLSIAIALKKNVRVIELKKGEQSNTRLLDLLSSISMSECVLTMNEDINRPFEPDWASVDTKLDIMRRNSNLYLSDIISKSEEK